MNGYLRSWLFWALVIVAIAKLYLTFGHKHFKAEWIRNVEKGKAWKANHPTADANQPLASTAEVAPGQPEAIAEKDSKQGFFTWTTILWIWIGAGVLGTLQREREYSKRQHQRSTTYQSRTTAPITTRQQRVNATQTNEYWTKHVASRHEFRFSQTPDPDQSAWAAAEEAGMMLIRSSTAIAEHTPAYVDKDLEAMVKRHAIREKISGQNILRMIQLMKLHELEEPKFNAVESSEMADEIAELFAAAPDAVPDWAQESLQQYFDDIALKWTPIFGPRAKIENLCFDR